MRFPLSAFAAIVAAQASLWAQPDLVARHFHVPSISFEQGRSGIIARFTVSYANFGNAPVSTRFRIFIYQDINENGCRYDPAIDQLVADREEPANLPPGLTSRITFPNNINVNAWGETPIIWRGGNQFPFCAMVDGPGTVIETNETNNSRGQDPPAAAPKIPVDLELSLSMDISGSVDDAEYRLQLSGYAQAFRDPVVQQAALSGRLGRIAVNVVMWAEGRHGQFFVAQDWSSLHNADSMNSFANDLENLPRYRGNATGVSYGLTQALPLFFNNDFEGTRKVLDVSGDGPENDAEQIDVVKTRQAALQQIDEINGLPIADPPGTPDVFLWYSRMLIGGRYAFAVPANGFSSFLDAVRLKLRLELSQPEPVIDDLVTRAKDASVDLLWTMIPRASGYNIYRRVGTVPYELIRRDHKTATASFTDLALQNDTRYDYMVRWLDADGKESGDSTEASATPTSRTARGLTAPTILSPPIVQAYAGLAYVYNLRASDPDIGEVLAYELMQGPTGLTINAATGQVQWAPPAGLNGAQRVKVAARDRTGRITTQAFRLFVSPVPTNHPPVIITSPVTAAFVGALYLYDVTATDANPGDQLTYSFNSPLIASALLPPAGMTINAQTGVIQWTPNAGQVGTFSVQVIALDNTGLAAIQYFTVTVSANQPPVFTSTPVTDVIAGLTYTYDVNAVDPEGKTVLYGLAQAPAGMTINSSNGLINWLPAVALANSSHPVSVRAADPTGGIGVQSFTVLVSPADNQRPTVSLITPTTGSILTGDATVTGTASDPNLRLWRVEYRAVGTNNWLILARGTTSVVNAQLGVFPVTLLANDVYRLRLYAEDIGGSVVSPEIEVQVNSQHLKMGDFTLSFEDLRVPGFTFPISIFRKYDTKRPQSGDFGPGWTLGFSEVEVRRDVNYNVFLTLPDGRRVSFRFTPQPAGLNVFNTAFTAQGGVYDTLENLDCPQVFGGGGGTFLCQGLQPWNPLNWRLRTKEGFTYIIGPAGIQRIEDRAGNWMQISPTGITSNTGRNVTIQRDAQNRITRIVEPATVGILTADLEYQYDAQGRLIRFLDQNNAPTSFFYENAQFSHYLTKIVDPLNRPTIRNVFNTEGRLVAQCDANANITTLAGCIRLDSSQAATRLFTATNARGFKTELFSDERGNVLRERRYLDATNYLETLRTYDANNNMLTERDPEGNTKTFTYDARGNRLTETDPGNRTTTYTYTPACDKVETITDPAGNATLNSYDAQCNLRFVRDPLLNTTEYRYNASAQRTQMIDPNGTTWTWAYNPNGLLQSLTDPFGKVTTFTFSNTGNLLSRVDRNGRRITFQYDAANRLTLESWDNGRVISYGYDSAGGLLTAVDPDTRVNMSYDNLGRLLTTDNIGTFGMPPVPITYSYDANGNVTRVRSSVVSYGDLITDYAYDGLDRLMDARFGGDLATANFAYSPAGLLTRIDRFSNIPGVGVQSAATTRYEYDCGGCPHRLTAIRHRQSSDNSVLHDLTFTRDPLGNITASTDRDGAHGYSYDKLRRLLSATHSNTAVQPNEVYTYDAAGNRLTSHISNSYSYNRNRLLQDQQFTYLYDDEGSTIRRTEKTTNAYTEYVYDHRNRLTTVVQRTSAGAETARVEYSYDGLNRRLRRATPGAGATYYIYDGLNPIHEITNTGALSRTRLYTRSIDGVLWENPGTAWFLTDQVGTIRDVWTRQPYFGPVPLPHFWTRYTYDSFGRVLRDEAFLYTGVLQFAAREWDQQTGLGFLRARYYQPATGRFVSEDRLTPFAYSYSSNNPMSFTDRSGLLTITEEGALYLRTALTITNKAFAVADFIDCAQQPGASVSKCAGGFVVSMVATYAALYVGLVPPDRLATLFGVTGKLQDLEVILQFTVLFLQRELK